jgi:predicted metal-binding membrane protein
MITSQTSDRGLLAASATFFAFSATLTVAGCASMSSMEAMPMPGGWAMSMAWMRMPGQTWGGMAASFVGMWDLMMAAMMLPSLVPALWRYRLAVSATAGMPVARLTVLVAIGYFCAWTLFGMLVFPLGAALAAAEMQWPWLARSVPAVTGVVVLVAGALQFTPWKTRHLARCRQALQRAPMLPLRTSTVWRQGMCLGLHCCLSCANLTAIQLVIGVMDLRAMAFVTAAITAERLAPASKLVAQVIGAVVIATGLFLIAG